MPTRVPKIFHQVWYEPPIHPRWQFARDAWRALLPDWEFRLWTKDNLPEILEPELLAGTRNAAEWSDIVRYEALRQFGGVYADADLFPVNGVTGEWLRTLGTTICADLQRDWRDNTRVDPSDLCNCLLIAEQDDPFWELIVKTLPGWIVNPPFDWRAAARAEGWSHCHWRCGPKFLSYIVREYQGRVWRLPIERPGIQRRAGLTLLPAGMVHWCKRAEWEVGRFDASPQSRFVHLWGGMWQQADPDFHPSGKYL